MKQNELLALIRRDMLEYVSSTKKSKNRASLAKNLNISPSTITKYLNSPEINPPADIIFKILRFFQGAEKARDIMQEFFPEWWEFNGSLIANNLAQVPNQTKFDFNQIHAKILEKAQMKSGANIRWVKEKFGTELGLPALEDLLHSGFIVEDDDAFRAKKVITDTNVHRLIARIKVDCDVFPVSEYGKSAFLVKNDDLVSEEARKKIVTLMRNMFNEIDQIKLDSLNNNEVQTEFLKINLFGSWQKDGGEN